MTIMPATSASSSPTQPKLPPHIIIFGPPILKHAANYLVKDGHQVMEEEYGPIYALHILDAPTDVRNSGYSRAVFKMQKYASLVAGLLWETGRHVIASRKAERHDSGDLVYVTTACHWHMQYEKAGRFLIENRGQYQVGRFAHPLQEWQRKYLAHFEKDWSVESFLRMTPK